MILKKHQFGATLARLTGQNKKVFLGFNFQLICLKGRDMVNTHLCANDKHWPCRL
jgi:hypothetical protein